MELVKSNAHTYSDIKPMTVSRGNKFYVMVMNDIIQNKKLKGITEHTDIEMEKRIANGLL